MKKYLLCLSLFGFTFLSCSNPVFAKLDNRERNQVNFSLHHRSQVPTFQELLDNIYNCEQWLKDRETFSLQLTQQILNLDMNYETLLSASQVLTDNTMWLCDLKQKMKQQKECASSSIIENQQKQELLMSCSFSISHDDLQQELQKLQNEQIENQNTLQKTLQVQEEIKQALQENLQDAQKLINISDFGRNLLFQLQNELIPTRMMLERKCSLLVIASQVLAQERRTLDQLSTQSAASTESVLSNHEVLLNCFWCTLQSQVQSFQYAQKELNNRVPLLVSLNEKIALLKEAFSIVSRDPDYLNS